MSSSRGVILALLCCLVVFEGLVISTISNWPWILDTSKTRIQEALYVSSPETGTNYFRLQQKPNRNLLVFIAVLTHASRKARRDAIRETWFSECQQRTTEARCVFFTDHAGVGNETKLALLKESEENKDMVFLSVEDNLAFTERLLQTMEWSTARHKFDYFLRIDDDHFLCLDRLLFELNFRPKAALYWGFVHCKANIVRVDEAWLLLTSDLIEEILQKRNTSLLCTPFADQAAALWMNNSTKNVTYFMDNQRIVHKSAGKDPKFFRKDACLHFLSLHGTYPRSMRQFWLVSHVLRKRDGVRVDYNVTEIQPFASLCPHSPVFNYKGFIPEFQFEPKPCSQNPKWSISGEVHVGREEHGERYSKY